MTQNAECILLFIYVYLTAKKKKSTFQLSSSTHHSKKSSAYTCKPQQQNLMFQIIMLSFQRTTSQQ